MRPVAAHPVGETPVRGTRVRQHSQIPGQRFLPHQLQGRWPSTPEELGLMLAISAQRPDWRTSPPVENCDCSWARPSGNGGPRSRPARAETPLPGSSPGPALRPASRCRLADNTTRPASASGIPTARRKPPGTPESRRPDGSLYPGPAAGKSGWVTQKPPSGALRTTAALILLPALRSPSGIFHA